MSATVESTGLGRILSSGSEKFRRSLTGIGVLSSPQPSTDPLNPATSSSTIKKAERWGRQCCENIVAELEERCELSPEAIERDYEELFRYKNRFWTGKLLHYVVHESADKQLDTSQVRLVLEASADINGQARYTRQFDTGPVVMTLEAIHIAAGMGSIPILKVLVESRANVGSYCKIGDANFYTPLHDAAYNGRPDAVTFLLENHADPSAPNKEGFTAMHLLAKTGLDREADVDHMVRTLLKHKARLDVKTKPTATDAGKIPLELAASDDSGFPRRLLHHLAPSFQDHTSYSFFDDMCKLSSLNPDSAKQLAMQFKEKSNDAAYQSRVRADAQGENAVDHMANLFHTAPDAAADMLDCLMAKPEVQDPGHHPIRTRAALSSSFCLGRAAPMRCAYQPDCKNKGQLKLPEWRFDASKGDEKLQLRMQPDIQWHLQLNSVPSDEDLRKEHVEDVDTKVVLIPNIIDIDIFMALARTRPSHLEIFERLPVQGIIYCLWDHLLRGAVYCWMAFNAIDILAQASVGLSAKSRTAGLRPLCMPLITAGLFRDIVNTSWHFYAHYNKYREHWGKFQDWEKQGHKDSATRPPGLHTLWRPSGFFTWAFLLTDVPIMLMKALFVAHFCSRGHSSSGIQQNVLTAVTLWQFMKLIWMFRLTIFGKNVNPMVHALCSAAVGELMIIILAFFSAVSLAFEMLGHPDTPHGFWLFLYRGLLHGDGGALDVMGLDPVREFGEGQGFGGKSLLGFIATLIFNIMILNLLIAVYGQQYEKLEKELESRFQRERAQHCCELLLSLQKIRLPKGTTTSNFSANLAVAAAALGVALAFGGGDHIQSKLFAGACFGTAQVAWHAHVMMSHWFPFRDDDREGPFDDHFLWICYRQDLVDQANTAETGDAQLDISDAVEMMEQKVEAAVREHSLRLEQKLGNEMDGLHAKVLSLDNSVEDLSSKLDKVLELLGGMHPYSPRKHAEHSPHSPATASQKLRRSTLRPLL